MKPIPFLQARHYRRGRIEPVRCVVIHTAEIGESLQGAEALMKVCAVNERMASWHYAVDADSVTQSVREEDTAFHAPGLSHCSVGIEHAGRAKQTADEWGDDFSQRMLELSAELTAGICKRHGIPCVRIGVEEVRNGHAGVCGHADVSKAFGKSDHWDPGPGFPWAHYMDRVMHYARQPATPLDPADEVTRPDLELKV